MDVSREIVVVEGDGQTYLVQLRQERRSSLLGPNSLGKLSRSLGGRLRWFVDVESESSLLPVLREQFNSESDARHRLDELQSGLVDGTVSLGRLPAVRWRRHRSVRR